MCGDAGWSAVMWGGVGLMWGDIGFWGMMLGFVGRSGVTWGDIDWCGWCDVGFCGVVWGDVIKVIQFYTSSLPNDMIPYLLNFHWNTIHKLIGVA